MSELVEIATVFKAVFERRPLPPVPQYKGDPPLDWLAERSRRYSHIRDVVCAALQASGMTAKIIGGGNKVDITARELRHADAIRLGDCGILSTELWALRKFRDTTGDVFVPAEIKEKAIHAAVKDLGTNTGGAPEHPAKAWYVARGCSRGGLSIGELQKLIKSELGVEPPSPNAIRNWEKDAQ